MDVFFLWHGRGGGGGGGGSSSSSPGIGRTAADCAGAPLTQAGARQSITLLIRQSSARALSSLPLLFLLLLLGPQANQGLCLGWAGLVWVVHSRAKPGSRGGENGMGMGVGGWD